MVGEDIRSLSLLAGKWLFVAVSQSVACFLSPARARPLALALSRRENESPSRINGVRSYYSEFRTGAGAGGSDRQAVVLD